MPFFSIIIPTYNRGDIILNAIQSALNQSFNDYEIIIVDDGSTDNTENIIQQIHHPHIFYYKISNSERGYARNYGATKASGEWIYFFDSDDLLYSNHLEKAYEIITKNNNLDIFSLGYDIITPSGKIIKTIKLKYTFVNSVLIKGNPLSCHGVFIKKSIFERFKFNEDRAIAGLEDWELWLRIATEIDIYHFPIVTSALVQHENRSVMKINKDKWIKKVETFVEYVISNSKIIKKYSSQLHKFYCSAYTYLSLHLSFDKRYKKESFRYLIKGLTYHPVFITQRRFFAIIRNLLLN